jgi:fumarate reductase subunit C
MDSWWWTRHYYYKEYMLREGTAIFALWVSFLLLIGLLNPDVFVKVMMNPLVMVLNAASLMAALYHTWTWLGLVPKALNLPEACLAKVVRGLWWTTGVVSFLFLLTALV